MRIWRGWDFNLAVALFTTRRASSFTFNLVEASCSGRDIYSRLPGLVGANHFAKATCRIQDIRQQ